MSNIIEIYIPDLGDAAGLTVIEMLANVGDEVTSDSPIIAVESDKAIIEIPAQQSGIIETIHLKAGDTIKEGDLFLSLKATVEKKTLVETQESTKQKDKAELKKTKQPSSNISANIVVIGGGPGGYTAAFRAADLGLSVVLVEKFPQIGGVCLNVGCIPSKALLHAAHLIENQHEAAKIGISYSNPKIDIDKIRQWKSTVVTSLTQGLKTLSKKRNIQIIQGEGAFIDQNTISVRTEDREINVSFEKSIIATGSKPIKINKFGNDPRIIDSTDALTISNIPKSLLIIGGGIIGLELATVYHALGVEISIVEMQDQLIPNADSDLVRPLVKNISKKYQSIWTNTEVAKIEASKSGLNVFFNGQNAPETMQFDQVLVAVGRSPNSHNIGIDKLGLTTNNSGFIPVNNQQQTSIANIFAIGDVVGQPMLAHKAVHEGKVAAEVCAKMKSAFVPAAIPSVAYTSPEIAWVGLTEKEAKAKNIDYKKATFPWSASGRALTQQCSEGNTKLLFCPQSKKVLGGGIVGFNAGDLIAEVALAIEMGCDAEDLALTIHAHPTLSETINFSAEMFTGTITDLYLPKKNK